MINRQHRAKAVRVLQKGWPPRPTATGQHSHTKRGLSADFQDEGEEEESVHLFVGSKKKNFANTNNFTHYFSYSACVGNIALVKTHRGDAYSV